MTRLIATEFRRFWRRRVVWLTTVIALALALLAFVISFINTEAGEPTNDDAVEIAQQQTDRCVSYFKSQSNEQLTQNFPEFEGLSNAEIDEGLRQDVCYNNPTWYRGQDKRFFALELLTEEYLAMDIQDWSDSRPDSSLVRTAREGSETYREADDGLLGGILPTIATFSLVLAVILGASFVGAEYKSGTGENWLLWKPRRIRVIVAKFIAGFVGSTVITMVFLAWVVGLLYLLAEVHGSTQGVDSRFWIDVVSVSIRASAVGGLFFIMAMSVAVVARNTTAAVGLIVGWFAISNIAIELAAKGLRRYELFVNALAFTTEANVPDFRTLQGKQITTYSHSYLTAGVALLIWTAVLALFATWNFVHRDID